MVSFILPVVTNLLVFTTLCNALCELSFEDDYILDCAYSDLTVVPTVEITDDVKSLDLSNNKLTKLKRSDWKMYTSIETLLLTENEISIIEYDTFSDLKKLTNLDLSNNKLSFIPPGLFSNNLLLESVNLRDNSELYISPKSPFLISETLSSLDLSLCRLTSLNPRTFSTLPGLVYLDVSNNSLTTVSLKTFDFLNDLDALDLRHNKWKCECEIVEVLNWVSNRRIAQGLHIQHSPVRCLDNGIYKPLWNAAKLNKPCQIGVPAEEERITQTPSEVTEISRSTQQIKTEKTQEENKQTSEKSTTRAFVTSTTNNPTSGHKKLLNTVTPVIDYEGHPKSEIPNPETPATRSWWDELMTWKIFIVLPITLAIAVFVALVAVDRCIKWLDSRSVRNGVMPQGRTYRHSGVPLLHSIVSDLKNSDSRRSIESSSYVDGVYHVYEEIQYSTSR